MSSDENERILLPVIEMTDSDNSMQLSKPSGVVDRAGESSSDQLSQNDYELWKSFKNGNESAFIAIYKAHFSNLYRYGFQFTKDKDLIKDAIQDLFIEIRKKRSNLSNTTSIKLYLYKCIRRKIIGLKLRARSKIINHHNLEGYNFDVELSVEHVLIIKQLDAERRNKLTKAMKALSDRRREAIYYFYYEELSYPEIAEIMEMGHVKSARNLIYKALRSLRKHFN